MRSKGLLVLICPKAELQVEIRAAGINSKTKKTHKTPLKINVSFLLYWLCGHVGIVLSDDNIYLFSSETSLLQSSSNQF